MPILLKTVEDYWSNLGWIIFPEDPTRILGVNRPVAKPNCMHSVHQTNKHKSNNYCWVTTFLFWVLKNDCHLRRLTSGCNRVCTPHSWSCVRMYTYTALHSDIYGGFIISHASFAYKLKKKYNVCVDDNISKQINFKKYM